MSFQLSISQVCKCKFNKKFGLNSLKHIFFVIHNFFRVCLLLQWFGKNTEPLLIKTCKKAAMSIIIHFPFKTQLVAVFDRRHSGVLAEYATHI